MRTPPCHIYVPKSGLPEHADRSRGAHGILVFAEPLNQSAQDFQSLFQPVEHGYEFKV